MDVRRDFLKYHRSIGAEFEVTKNRIRQLIGSKHWGTDGEHKESVLRNVLQNHLPANVIVGSGFICAEDSVSTQIDVLITDSAKPSLFRSGQLAVVTPDAVRAVIEVKTSLGRVDKLRETVQKLSDAVGIARERSHLAYHHFAGLFVFEGSPVTDADVLTALRDAAFAGRFRDRFVNWIALGPQRFFRFWDRGSTELGIIGNVWHSYKLPPNLAHAYFVSNVVWDLTQDGWNDWAQYAWFPIQSGKEQYRQWYISGENDAEPQPF